MKLGPLSKVKVMYKLIGAFLILAFLTMAVGSIGIMGINSLNGEVGTIVNKNAKQTDNSLQAIYSLQTQVADVHAYMLGEYSAQTEFTNQVPLIQNETNFLKSSFAGTAQEASITNIQSSFNELNADVTNTTNGLFITKDRADAAQAQIDKIYWALDSMQDTLNGKFTDIQNIVIQYSQAKGIKPNVTLTDDALKLDIFIWQMGDLARMYIKTDSSNNNATNVAERNSIRAQFADVASIQNDASMPQSGVEHDYYQTFIDAKQDFTNAIAAGQVNSTPLSVLSNIQALTFFNASTTSFTHYVRNSKNGLFTTFDTFVLQEIDQYSIMDLVDVVHTTILTELNNLQNVVTTQMASQYKEAQSVNASSVNSTMLIMFVVVISSIAMGFIITFHLVSPIKGIMKVSEEVANGNLEVDTSILVKGRTDEIGKVSSSFQIMIDGVLGNIMDAVGAVSNISNSLAASAQELSTSSEEVNASSEEISSITQQMAKGSQDQVRLITETTKSVTELQTEFAEKIQEINQTAFVIENISSQVNMLALNASIEAARAGEYGRGFAVVADNIRRLADDSNSSVSKVQNTITVLRDSLAKSIDNIVVAINQVASVAEETASGSEEASAATEEQAATMEELTASAQELANMSSSLETAMTKFSLNTH